MTSLDQATRAARALARLAAIRRAGPLSCPYPAGSTGIRSAARRVWLAEYLRLRPPAPGVVDFGDLITDLANAGAQLDPGAMPARPEPDLFAPVPQ